MIVPSDVDMPCSLPGSEREGRYLSLANGLVNVDRLLADKTVEIENHTPNYFTTMALPYAYDPTATCPQWEKFLAQVLSGDEQVIGLFEEWWGYCLVKDTSQHKFLLLSGEGANGKSVIADVLTGIVGVRM